MDCPICMPKEHQMTEGFVDTEELENGVCLICLECGFSIYARSQALLVNVHDTLWKHFPGNEAV